VLQQQQCHFLHQRHYFVTTTVSSYENITALQQQKNRVGQATAPFYNRRISVLHSSSAVLKVQQYSVTSQQHYRLKSVPVYSASSSF
jgi:hypothetical protein